MRVSAFLIEIGFNKIGLFYRLDKSEEVWILEKRLGDVDWKGEARHMHISTLLSVQDKHSEFGIADSLKTSLTALSISMEYSEILKAFA